MEFLISELTDLFVRRNTKRVLLTVGILKSTSLVSSLYVPLLEGRGSACPSRNDGDMRCQPRAQGARERERERERASVPGKDKRVARDEERQPSDVPSNSWNGFSRLIGDDRCLISVRQ